MDIATAKAQLADAALPPGWKLCSPAEGLALAAQLRREVRPGHALHQASFIALAKRGSCEDVLFAIEADQTNALSLALVRLTWHVPRHTGSFPWAERFTSVDHWLGRCAA